MMVVDKGNDSNVTGDGTDYTQFNLILKYLPTNADSYITSSHTFTAPVTGIDIFYFL